MNLITVLNIVCEKESIVTPLVFFFLRAKLSIITILVSGSDMDCSKSPLFIVGLSVGKEECCVRP